MSEQNIQNEQKKPTIQDAVNKHIGDFNNALASIQSTIPVALNQMIGSISEMRNLVAQLEQRCMIAERKVVELQAEKAKSVMETPQVIVPSTQQGAVPPAKGKIIPIKKPAKKR